MPELKDFLQALDKLGRVSHIIFKGSMRNPKIFDEIQADYNDRVVDDKRETLLENPERAIELINSTHEDEKVVILDMGGIFCPYLI